MSTFLMLSGSFFIFIGGVGAIVSPTKVSLTESFVSFGVSCCFVIIGAVLISLT